MSLVMGNSVLPIICNLVACVILLSNHVSGNTNGSEPLCLLSIKVQRNKLHTASVNTLFEINCNVTIVKCEGIPSITWCKIYGNDCKALNQSNYIETMWKNITTHDGILFLTFLNITMEDAGLYRCKSQNSVSHTLNVTVTADADADSSNQNNTSEGNIIELSKNDLQWLLPHVYICGGLAGLVILLITVSTVVIRCQGRKSTTQEMTTTNLYTEAQRSDPTTPPHPNHNTHPPSAKLTSAVSCAYDTPPVRAGSHRDRPSAGRVSANMTESKGFRNNVRTAEEEENLLVYASLNHQAIARGPRRTVQEQQTDEPSEYAAIRFR